MEWPPDNAPASLEDLTTPICAAIRFAYRLRRQNQERDIPWTGPEIGSDEQANALLAQHQLRATNMAYSLNDQGRDALTEIIALGLRIGIEQGRRIFKASSEYQTLRIQAEIGALLVNRDKDGRTRTI